MLAASTRTVMGDVEEVEDAMVYELNNWKTINKRIEAGGFQEQEREALCEFAA